MAKKVNIAHYISTLLYDYSSVVVPGFGAFMTQYVPAKVNTETGVVSPPIKTVQFNEKLNLNDGLLLSHIARHERISDAESEAYLTHFVNNILEQLDNGQTVMLEGIGTITQAPGTNQLTFMPSSDVNFSTDTFGLTSVELPHVELDEGTVPAEITAPPVGAEFSFHSNDDEQEDEDGNEEEVISPLITPASEKRSVHDVLATGGGNAAVSTSASANEEPVAPEPKKANYWWWLIPVLLLVVFIVVLTQMPSGRKGSDDIAATDSIADSTSDTTSMATNEDNSNSLEEDAGNSDGGNNTASTTGNDASSNITNNADEPTGSTSDVRGNAATEGTGTTTTTTPRGNATTVTEVPATPTSSTTDSRGNAANTSQTPPAGYYVVIASLDSKAKAQKMASKLSKTSDNVYTLSSDNGKYRVGYHYTSQSNAQSAQDKFKATYSGAWILKL